MARYPRASEPLVPAVLRPLLEIPLPSWAERRDARFASLADLDASAWGAFSADECQKLGDAVIGALGRVGEAGVRGLAGRMMIENLPPHLDLSELELSVRTSNVLDREGFTRDPSRLSRTTFDELLDLRNFGVRSLLDLLAACEAHQWREPTPEELATEARERVEAEAKRLQAVGETEAVWRGIEAVSGAGDIGVDDPRLGPLLRKLDSNAENLASAAQGLRATGGFADRMTREALEQILQLLTKASDLALEEELKSLVEGRVGTTQGAVVSEHLGWGGGPRRSLRDAGRSFGMSGERVRQITHKATSALAGVYPWAPILDRALADVAARVPDDLPTISVALQERGISKTPFDVRSLKTAAEVFNREFPWTIEGSEGALLLVTEADAALLGSIRSTAKRSVSRRGVGNMADVSERASTELGQELSEQLVREVVEALPGYVPLDDEGLWFYLDGLSQQRNALLNSIAKIVSVAPTISLSELRDGCRRHYRTEHVAPPSRILRVLLEHLDGFVVADGIVRVDPVPDWHSELADTEQILVRVLTANGPVMHTYDLERACANAGMNRNTFWVYLSYSPILARVAPGYYSLRGADIPPGILEALGRRRKTRKFTRGHGWMTDGTPWVVLELSQSTASSGVISLPSGFRATLEGTFVLEGADGIEVGTMVAKGAAAWGFSGMFRRQGAEEGDLLRLEFDLASGVARAILGDDSLALADGDEDDPRPAPENVPDQELEPP